MPLRFRYVAHGGMQTARKHKHTCDNDNQGSQIFMGACCGALATEKKLYTQKLKIQAATDFTS